MNVSELQKRMAANIKEKAEAPTEGSDEWNLYLSFLNQAQRDWAEGYQWKQLYKEVNTFNGSATLTLPTDFRKYDGPMRISTGGGTYEYQEIKPQERTQYLDTDRYMYILGDPSNGYNAVINPGTLASTNSIYYSYYANAATLASPADVSMIPDPMFLQEQALSHYWRTRDDSRFLVAERRADAILRRMLEFEQVEGQSYDDRIKTYEETRSSFRIGRD